jgi:hypothetical protein
MVHHYAKGREDGIQTSMTAANTMNKQLWMVDKGRFSSFAFKLGLTSPQHNGSASYEAQHGPGLESTPFNKINVGSLH